MPHRFALLSLLALLLSPAARAASPGGPFGLGIGGGLGVSGLSMKYYLGNTAFQGMVGTWGLGRVDGGGIAVGADYLYEMPDLASFEPLAIAWNLGLGGTVGLGDEWTYVLASGVAGLEFNFQPVPIDIVLEYRPGVSLVPGVGADLVNFSGHIRYYF